MRVRARFSIRPNTYRRSAAVSRAREKCFRVILGQMQRLADENIASSTASRVPWPNASFASAKWLAA